MSMGRANNVLNILRRVDIPVHEVRRGDLIADGFDGMLVARVEHHEDGSIGIFDENDNGSTYPPHGREWKVRIVERGSLIDDPFSPWE